MIWDRTNRPLWLRCAAGVLAAVLAAAIRFQFLGALELRATFLTFYPAVAVAALYGGFSAGLPATIVSAALADYFWMEPVGQFGITNSADLLSLVVFVASGALISYIAEATYSAQARAHKAEEQSKLSAERETAAVALQKSETRYRELVQNANSAIIRWKRDGAIAFFNEYAQKFFGYSAEEVIGRNVNILMPEKESTGGDLTGLLQDIVNHPDRYVNYINENVLRDGSRVWMAWTNRPVFDDDGQVVEILAVGSDITGRKRIEEELTINQSRLDLALRSAHMGVWHLDMVENRRYFDDQVCHLLGLNPAKFTGTAEEFFKAVHPDDREMLEAAWARTIERNVPYEAEYRVVWPDGSVHYVTARGKLVHDDKGRPARVNGLIWDITEHRRAEMERETTVEFLHFVNQSSGTADLVRAAATFFQRQSGCEAVGIRLKEGEDYPYYEARGFPSEFVEKENSLCARDAAGNIIRDIRGDPYIECMCGNIICGRVDPSKPFFSPGGSFWANSTTRLLATTSDTERRTRTRNRCNGEGYESVALIPLSMGAERMGLLQLNDRREGMFSPEVIAQYERLAGYLAVGLAKSESDEKIRRQNEVLETINQIFCETLTSETEEQLCITCLKAVEDLTQSKLCFIGEIGPDGLLHDLAISSPGWELRAMYDKSGHRRPPGDFRIRGLYGRVLAEGKSLLTNDPSSHPDSIGIPQGQPALTAFLGAPLLQDGKTIGMIGLGNREGGYTLEHQRAVEAIAPAVVVALMRKRAEAALNRSQSRFKLLSDTASQLLASENPQAIVEKLCRQVMQHLGCHVFFNFLVDETMGKLHLNACAGIPEEEARKIEWLDFGVAVCGCAARDGRRIVAEDIFNTPDIRTELVKSYGIQAYACHPLEVQGKIIGTLSFGAKTRTRFPDEALALMKTVADQVAISMEKLRLINELRNSRDELELRVRERTAELKSYMAKLEQNNQSLQDFASIAAHDLKEPLRKVSSFGIMLRQKYEDALGQTGNDYLDRMLNATERMQSLLAGLLDYSRVATTSEPFVEVDLCDLIGEVLSDLEVRIVKTGGEVHFETLPVISADPTQMRQLFQNLIGNALKFHKPDEKPIVRVRSVSSTDAACQIVVEDNGIGFEEQYLEKIFAPFQKLHGRREFEGTGLGLAICRKIVERHGGSITAGSTPGVGSKFVVTLPVPPRRD
jgi:PAS domain S-box-containing protein